MRLFTALVAFSLTVSAALSAQVQYETKNYTVSEQDNPVTADFNRDGRPDIAVGGSTGVDVLFGVGGGHFGTPVHYPSATPGIAFAADVNNDSWPDIINASNGNNPSISVLLNNQNGTFRAGPQRSITAATAGLSAAGDLNRDGKIDLVFIESAIGGGFETRLQVFKGTGTGSFTAGQTLSLSGRSGKVDIEDMNGDGILDLVNVVPTKALIWPGNGDGTFRTPIMIARPSADGLGSSVVADFNNDGIPDLAINASHHCPDDPNHLCGTNNIFVYRNNGSAAFTRVSSFTMGVVDGGVLYASDLNGDLNIDLAVVQGGAQVGTFTVAPGNGNGTFGTPYQNFEPDNHFVLFRDFDLDSRHDFALLYSLSPEVSVSLARSGFTNCATPPSGAIHAKICGPASNASVASPVLVRASGNSPIGVKRLEVWIDGKKQTQRFNDQLAKRFTLSPGSHRIAVVAVDRYRGTSTTAVNVNVQ
jgi:hypothetical protein